MGTQALSWQKEEWLVTENSTESTWIAVALWGSSLECFCLCASVARPGKDAQRCATSIVLT